MHARRASSVFIRKHDKLQVAKTENERKMAAKRERERGVAGIQEQHFKDRRETGRAERQPYTDIHKVQTGPPESCNVCGSLPVVVICHPVVVCRFVVLLLRLVRPVLFCCQLPTYLCICRVPQTSDI